MPDVASLSLEVRTDQVKQSRAELRALASEASATERMTKKWGVSTDSAGKSAEEFSKRVRRNIADLEFERQQLARSASERARYAALKRAGVAEGSAEAAAVTASVRALQAQQTLQAKATEQTRKATEASREFGNQWMRIGAMLAGTIGASAVLKAADSFTKLTNAIKVTGAEGSSLLYVQERLFAAANKNGVEVEALGTLYSRVAMAGKELGISQMDLLAFTDGVTAALKVQGGSAEQASGALLQLSQALGAGTVRAEEFNSILEGAMPIAQAAARGMDGMGGSVAKLRAAVIAGTVTSKAFFEGTMKGFEETKRQAEGSSLTIGQSLTALSNRFTNFIGQLDKTSGASAAAARWINALGKAMDEASVNQQLDQPKGLFGTGIGDLGGTISSTVKEIEGINAAFQRAQKWLMENVPQVAEAAKSWVGGIGDAMSIGAAQVWATFTEPFRELGTWIADLGQKAGVWFGDAWERAKAATIEKFGGIAQWVKDNLAMLLSPFEGLGDALGKIFSNAWEKAKTATIAGLQGIGTAISDKAKEWGISFGESKTGGFVGGVVDRAKAAGEEAARQQAAAVEEANRIAGEQKARQALIDRQAGMETDERRARLGGMPVSGPLGLGGGGGGAAPSKAAVDAAKKYAELTAELELTAAAQDKMTAAAAKGDLAFEAQKASLDAQQKMLDIYNVKLAETDPRLTKVRDLMLSIAQGKVAESFNVQTTELEKQNVVLEAQIRLMNQAPEIQAREIALIKAKQEAEKAGTAVTAEMIELRRRAIEQNETLKNQAEELKKAQELWMAPLKSALESIQKTAADAFENMLESGKFNFAELGNVFKKTIIRMAAEFLALQTVKPIMSVVVNAIGGSGLSSQLGLGGTTGGTGSGTMDLLGSAMGLGAKAVGSSSGSGGGGLFSGLFGGGGGGGSLFTVPQAGPLQPGAAALPGTSIFNPALGTQMGSFGMSNLSGALGVGMGAMSLLNGGTKTTAGTIGGIGQMVGGGLMMIPTPWTMAAGAIISMASSIIPGLFGSDPPAVVNQEYGQLSYGGSGFGTSGGAWGPDANAANLQGPLAKAGQTIQGLFTLMGGVKDASKVWGIAMESYSKKDGKGWDFQNQTSYLVGPNGQKTQWGQGSTAQDVGMDAASAQLAARSIIDGAVGAITENMRKALTDAMSAEGGGTLEIIRDTIVEISAFDAAVKTFGKTTNEAETALQSVNDSFNDLRATAEKYGLAASEVAKIDAEQARQRLLLTEDFSSGIKDALMEAKDPVMAAVLAVEKARVKDIETNRIFLEQVVGYNDQAAAINELYLIRRNKVMDEANAAALAAQKQAAEAAAQVARDLVGAITQSVANIQDLLRELSPAGSLGNADPQTYLAALRANNAASFAQASADPANQALIDQAVADARLLAQTSLKYNAGDANYEEERQSLIEQQRALQEMLANIASQQQIADPELKNLVARLLTATQQAANNNTSRDPAMVEILALLSRYLANGRTAA